MSQAAAPLPVDNFSYIGPPMETPRYFHTATVLERGQVLLVGGSDESTFTSLEDAEIFDQTLIDDPRPESLSGDFVDTNFVGDPITLNNGGRIFHTTTLLPDGNAIVIGGTFDILISEAIPRGEIFDPQSRRFNPDGLEPGNEMLDARFRHTATLLANGKLLIAGGQRSQMETIVDPNFPPGSPFFQFDLTVFPTIRSFEYYNPASRMFESVSDISGSPVQLQTPRGRSGHSSVRIAGFDNRLQTADDVVLIGSGFQSFSGIFAPDLKFPGDIDLDNQTSLEYFDLATGTVAFAPGLFLAPHVNGGRALNVGQFASATPDGVEGVNNISLFFNGDNDGTGACTNSTEESDLVICTFTGFGPANGIQFLELSFGNHQQGLESFIFDPMNCGTVGRTHGDAEVMNNQRSYDGVIFNGNWIINTGGNNIFPVPGACVQDGFGSCGSIQVMQYFDPFYDAAVDPPWDLTLARAAFPGNPTGVIGTWMQADDTMPSETLDLYADQYAAPAGVIAPPPPYRGVLRARRIGHTASRVPGEDGVLNTPDDRLLIAGGGEIFWVDWGGLPVSITCEIYLPENANGL